VLQWFSGLGIATNAVTQEVMMSQNTNNSPVEEAVNKQQQQWHHEPHGGNSIMLPATIATK